MNVLQDFGVQFVIQVQCQINVVLLFSLRSLLHQSHEYNSG